MNISADLLLIEEEQLTATLAPALRASYTVAVTATAGTATEYLRRSKPLLVVAGLDVLNGDSLNICREAKLIEPPVAVLVTTASLERMPDVLDAGCDGVLLKPFAPNLHMPASGACFANEARRFWREITGNTAVRCAPAHTTPWRSRNT